ISDTACDDALAVLELHQTSTSYHQPDYSRWLVGLVERVEDNDRLYPFVDNHTRVTGFTYDTNGLLFQTFVDPPNVSSDFFLFTTMIRDEFGNIEQVVVDNAQGDTPARAVTSTYADDHVFRATSTNALGHETRVVYDARFGAPSIVVDPNRVITRLGYDGFGRLVEQERAGITTTVDFSDTWSSTPDLRGVMAVTTSMPEDRKSTRLNSSHVKIS